MKDALDLANVIMAMNYGALKGVAGELSKMVDPDVRPKVETPEEFAEMLFDWAEATQSDAARASQS